MVIFSSNFELKRSVVNVCGGSYWFCQILFSQMGGMFIYKTLNIVFLEYRFVCNTAWIIFISSCLLFLSSSFIKRSVMVFVTECNCPGCRCSVQIIDSNVFSYDDLCFHMFHRLLLYLRHASWSFFFYFSFIVNSPRSNIVKSAVFPIFYLLKRGTLSFFHGLVSFWNKKTSPRSKSGECGGWDMIKVWYGPKKSRKSKRCVRRYIM